MNAPYLRDLRADAVELQKQAGQWVVAGITTSVPWPQIPQVVEYVDCDFIMRPPDEQRMPTIALNASKHGLTVAQALDRIREFGTALAWYFGDGFEIFDSLSGSMPFGMGQFRGGVSQSFMEPDVLTVPPDEGAAVAMAFYREGLSIKNPFYAFLSLFKAIASIHRAKARGAWMADALPKLANKRAADRVAELQAQNENVSDYLFRQCRNAIAHAEIDEEFVNPDRGEDHRRIERDLPVVQALAQWAIRERYDIDPKNPRSQIEIIPGFEAWLGQDLIRMFRDGEEVRELPDVPDPIVMLARRQHEVVSLGDMHIAQCKQHERGIVLQLIDKAETMEIIVLVDLQGRTLQMNPMQDVDHLTNMQSRSSIDGLIRMKKFVAAIFGNGRLELWDKTTGELLGRTGDYMPVNMFFDSQKYEQELDKLKAMRDAASEA